MDAEALKLVISFISGGFVTEGLRRYLDGRLRRNVARGKLIAALTRLELMLAPYEEVFGTGGSARPGDDSQRVLDEFGAAIGEARLELSEPVINAAMLLYEKVANDFSAMA